LDGAGVGKWKVWKRTAGFFAWFSVPSPKVKPMSGKAELGLGRKSFHPSHFYLSFAFPNVLSAEKKQKPSFILLINSFDEEFFLKPQIYSLKITP